MKRRPYTEEELEAIAAKYDVLKDFRMKEKPVYKAILRRNLLKEICGHMKRGYEDYTDQDLSLIHI